MRLTTKYLESENYFADEISEDATEEERNEYLHSIIAKLGQLEDIEDELGIDLITLFKIYKNGFAYIDEKNKIKQIQQRDLLVSYLAIQPEYKRMIGPGYHWYFKDYGKTWALTKEELS